MAKRRERERRERRRAGSGRRDSKHRAGGDWTNITLPDGVSSWKPEAKSHRIDTIPYEVGKGNEYADPGDWYYELTYFAHRGIGAEPNNFYVCPAKTKGKACPICEYRGKLASDPDSDIELVKGLKAKERQLWLIFDHDNKDEGVQLWEFSHWNFGKLLDQVRKDADEDETHITDFDDPEAGSSLKVSFSEESGGGHQYLKAYNISFKPRPNGLPEELLDHGICLDSLLKIESYEKLKAILYQTEEEDSVEEEKDKSTTKKRGRPKGSKTKPKKPKEDEEQIWDEFQEQEVTPPETDVDKPKLSEGDMAFHNEFLTCEIVRISEDGTSLVLEDADGNIHKAVGIDEVELVDNPAEPEEEKPKKKTTRKKSSKKAPPKKKESEPKEEPEEDDDWNDEPETEGDEWNEDDDNWDD